MSTKLFLARKIHTFAADVAAANAIAVSAGRIADIGNIQQLRARWPHAAITDFGDRIITPGLTDAHIHLTEWAVARRQVQLADGRTIDDCLQIIQNAQRNPEHWLMGRGWNPHSWGGSYPTAAQLDDVVSDVPAAFQSHDMHALWVNSRALQVAGIDTQTPDPPGGRIVRDDAGNATGMLLETAAQLVIQQVPRIPDDQMLAAVVAAQRELHEYGITGIHSFPGVHLPEPQPLTVLQKLHERGQLALRVLQHISEDQLEDAIGLGMRSGIGDEWIRAGGVKMFLDGALGSRTAWMREPYEGSANCGVQVLSSERFRSTVTTAADAGIATVVHAIGDAAVALAFDVLSAVPRVRALPHRVEHVQCFPLDRAELLSRGIVCSVQPCHLMTDWRAVDRHWGRRAEATYAFRTLAQHGAMLAFGSDAPVESADPRLGLYAAVARRDTGHEPEGGWYGQQCLTNREAFAGYTLGAAVAAGATGQQGVLQHGALADFAVWDDDPLSCAPEDLLRLRVAATVVNGDVVFEG